MDDDLLMLSGIQHFMYCPRQWALIHIEQQWADNALTTEGQLLHQRVDDPLVRQLNNGVLTLRRMPLISRRLGLSGLSDAVECRAVAEGELGATRFHGREGWWSVMPVEYKHGREKADETDDVQLCAQCMAIEEMKGVRVARGAIFYWQTRKRVYVDMTDSLRAKTENLAAQMRKLMAEGRTPPPTKTTRCGRCSLADVCMPKETAGLSAKTYLRRTLYAEDA